MADTKISALTPATTPLAGTEVLPIVQSSTTKKVSVADLTVGRQVAANSLIVQGVATQTNGVAALYLDYTPGTSTTKIEAINPGFAYLPLQINAGTTYLQTNGVDRVTLAAGGNVTVNTGNLIIGTSGNGIDFSATPGTGTSELLADYEEGTWTPASTTFALTVTAATYTKIGRQVFIAFDVTYPVTVSASAASITAASLPFAPASASGNFNTGYTTYTSPIIGAISGVGITFYNRLGNPASGLIESDLSTARVIGSCTYTV